MAIDHGLRAYATPREAEFLDAIEEHGSARKAGKALGLGHSAVSDAVARLRQRAARQGYAPAEGLHAPQPAGFHIKGISTLTRDLHGNQQWIKSEADKASRLDQLREAVATIAEPFRSAAAPVPCPLDAADDLLCVYPMGDPHLGLYAWHEDACADWDLEAGEAVLVEAVDRLVSLAPAARHACVINLGDFFHSDNSQNRTMAAGNALDVDTRWAKVLSVGIRAMRRVIDRCLERHEFVRVICEIGNHDDHSSVMLALCLANYYEREPRVSVDTSPAKFHWLRFGDCLLGVTHGHRVKAPDLPAVMACDKAKDWGDTRHRHWYTGHVHHDQLKEYPGCTVETLRTLAPGDAWHHAQGYRAGRDLKLDVWHRQHGRINRHIVGIDQLCQK